MRYDDLGEMEVSTVTSTATTRSDQHIIALEEIVDNLREENRLLKRELALTPSTITQEQYDLVCTKLQAEYNKEIPF